MRGLADLTFKTDYRKGRDDIAREFYLPCMAVSDRYDRAVGFFNSAIYVIAWPSLKDFVARGARMRLVCSPVLPPNDIEAIETGYSQRFEQENGGKMRDDFRYMLDTPYLYKPATVLATLVALGVVDIRIAFMKKTPRHERLFHDKLGLFYDASDNVVVFKGSMNETWAGLSADGNLESVDVFLSWEHAREASRVEESRTYFEELWENKFGQDSLTVKQFPDIARSELLSAADAKRWPDLVDEICREIEAAEKFEQKPQPTQRGSKILRPHQASALQGWEAQGRRGIFEHATGSGKTFTALCAIRNALSRHEVPVIVVPTELLLGQWYDELQENLPDLNLKILRCGAGHTKWRDGLLGAWTRTGSNENRVVLSTMQTAATSDFMGALKQGDQLFLVADEVHRIGSPNHLRLLTLSTGPRLGLSATPRRAGDPYGTKCTFDYFGGVVPPPFTLQDAIKSGALTPYFYHIHTADLSQSEQEEWDRITKLIRQLAGQNASSKTPDPNANLRIERLLIERSRILKGAASKALKAAHILADNYKHGDRWIVYCDDLVQLAAVRRELTARGIDSFEYHSDMAGDKTQTLCLFETNGGIVVSIRCLDEGVDIPSVTHALILASSKNPREYIQRRGRVLRRAEGKAVAHIHDLVILPTAVDEEREDKDPRISIIGGEVARALEFGRTALNPAAITDLERIVLRFSRDYKSLLEAGYEDDV